MTQETLSDSNTGGICDMLEPKLVECRVCKVTFTTPVARVLGRVIFASLCDACGDPTEPKPVPVSREARRSTRWTGLVGTYFSDFAVNKLPLCAQAICGEVLSWSLNNVGVGITGPTYTGKSMIIHELGRRLYVAGVDVYPTSGVKFGQMVGGKADDMAGWREYLRRCVEAEVLLLDDADKLNLTQAVEAEYYAMFELRRRWLRPVLATTNLSGKEFADLGSDNRGAPIITRLRSLCTFKRIS